MVDMRFLPPSFWQGLAGIGYASYEMLPYALKEALNEMGIGPADVDKFLIGGLEMLYTPTEADVPFGPGFVVNEAAYAAKLLKSMGYADDVITKLSPDLIKIINTEGKGAISSWDQALASQGGKTLRQIAAELAGGAPKTAGTAAEAGTSANVPTMITNAMESQLKGMGYAQEAINAMTPTKAWEILKGVKGAADIIVGPGRGVSWGPVSEGATAPITSAIEQEITGSLDLWNKLISKLQGRYEVAKNMPRGQVWEMVNAFSSNYGFKLSPKQANTLTDSIMLGRAGEISKIYGEVVGTTPGVLKGTIPAVEGAAKYTPQATDVALAKALGQNSTPEGVFNYFYEAAKKAGGVTDDVAKSQANAVLDAAGIRFGKAPVGGASIASEKIGTAGGTSIGGGLGSKLSIAKLVDEKLGAFYKSHPTLAKAIGIYAFANFAVPKIQGIVGWHLADNWQMALNAEFTNAIKTQDWAAFESALGQLDAIKTSQQGIIITGAAFPGAWSNVTMGVSALGVYDSMKWTNIVRAIEAGYVLPAELVQEVRNGDAGRFTESVTSALSGDFKSADAGIQIDLSRFIQAQYTQANDAINDLQSMEYALSRAQTTLEYAQKDLNKIQLSIAKFGQKAYDLQVQPGQTKSAYQMAQENVESAQKAVEAAKQAQSEQVPITKAVCDGVQITAKTRDDLTPDQRSTLDTTLQGCSVALSKAGVKVNYSSKYDPSSAPKIIKDIHNSLTGIDVGVKTEEAKSSIGSVSAGAKVAEWFKEKFGGTPTGGTVKAEPSPITWERNVTPGTTPEERLKTEETGVGAGLYDKTLMGIKQLPRAPAPEVTKATPLTKEEKLIKEYIDRLKENILSASGAMGKAITDRRPTTGALSEAQIKAQIANNSAKQAGASQGPKGQSIAWDPTQQKYVLISQNEAGQPVYKNARGQTVIVAGGTPGLNQTTSDFAGGYLRAAEPTGVWEYDAKADKWKFNKEKLGPGWEKTQEGYARKMGIYDGVQIGRGF